uniref:Peroxisomal membrane protein MPV17 n=1 Tax=Zooxanthella nutricula TaxID=1333877 RepID=A0A7S2HE64_9DINO
MVWRAFPRLFPATATLRRPQAVGGLPFIVAAYDTLYGRRPLSTAAVTLGVKAGCCDVVAQKLAQPGCELDVPRIAKFGVFCMFYAGSFQHLLYNVVYPRLFVRGSGVALALQMSAFDNLVHVPFLYLPAYYAYRGLLLGDGFKASMEKYRHEGLDVLPACWAIWGPAQCITFWLVPPNFRIAFAGAVGAVWEAVLSYKAPLHD